MARTIYALIDLAGNIIKAIANNPTILGLVLLYLIISALKRKLKS